MLEAGLSVHVKTIGACNATCKTHAEICLSGTQRVRVHSVSECAIVVAAHACVHKEEKAATKKKEYVLTPFIRPIKTDFQGLCARL